jgi:hypothetical protein
MLSLKDKLLKAGLVSEEQAKKADEEKAKASERKASPPPARPAAGAAPRADRPPPRGPARPDQSRRPPPREAAPMRIPKLPPLPGSKEAQRNDAKKQVQQDRFLREKVLAAQVAIESGTTTFYFVTRKQKLRRLELSEGQAKMLEEGKLAVVERPDPDRIEHALVPPEAAAELFAQSEKAVRFWNREGQAVGFLTEAEIAARHSEADEVEAPPAPAVAAPAATQAPGETWITIKRA